MILLEKMDFPDPVIEIAIEPKSKADQEKLGVALQKLAAEDPTFRVSTDQESRPDHPARAWANCTWTSRSTSCKPHLQGRRQHRRAAGGLSRDASGARPRSTTPTRSRPAARASSRAIKIIFEPVEPGVGLSRSRARWSAATCRKEFIPGVEKGLASAKENGLLAGFPVIDFKATLIDGAYHDVDSSVLAFEIAARAAFRELRDKARPKLLEPIMKVEVTTPEDYVGDVIGDLNSRRGQIQGTDQRGNAQVDHRHGAAGQHVRLCEHPARR